MRRVYIEQSCFSATVFIDISLLSYTSLANDLKFLSVVIIYTASHMFYRSHYLRLHCPHSMIQVGFYVRGSPQYVQ